jgi:HAMP domain-containing protein
LDKGGIDNVNDKAKGAAAGKELPKNLIKEQLRTSIRGKILGTQVLIIIVFAAIVIFYFQQNMHLSSLQIIKNTQGVYNSILANDTKMLSAAVNTFSDDESYKQIYAQHDRDKLTKAGENLFKTNHDKFSITHFYFIDNDGTCFLRLHKPELFGDAINRKTFLKAKETGDVASGLELGKTAFALRVVAPYVHRGYRIGFVEMGEEIEHFDQIVKKETGNDVAVLIDKSLLDEKAYRQTRATAGQRDDWNDLQGYAMVSATIADRKFIADKVFKEAKVRAVNGPSYFGTVNWEGKSLMQGAFPLHDVTGKKVGVVLVLSNIQEQVRHERITLVILLVAGLILFVGSFLFTYRHLKTAIITPLIELSNNAIDVSMGNVDKKMDTDRTDEIGMLIRSFERMRVSLKKSMDLLTKR